jgi:putative FmdB family regulatory protein
MRYDFYCPKDNREVRDIDMLMNDPAPSCPECGDKMERLFSGQRVTLRGLTTPGNGS